MPSKQQFWPNQLINQIEFIDTWLQYTSLWSFDTHLDGGTEINEC